MRILHCCLAAFYVDNYGYQENILPKMHKLQGHEVRIVASTETYLDNRKLGYTNPRSYNTPENIPIIRLPYIKVLPHIILKKLRVYVGLSKILEDFKPEIIFLHDVQFLSVHEIARYAKRNVVKIYVDCHTDFINSGKNWLSKNILHKFIYKWCAKVIEPHVQKFYGVLPIRVDFLKKVYGISHKKLDLLVLGADDTQYDLTERINIRKNIRLLYNISEYDFLIVSGGKIDRRKNIHILLESFQNISQDYLKLIVFGSITDDMRDEIDKFKEKRNIILTGWLSVNEIYKILMASDLGFFPGTHSVLWEQSVGIGLPCVFKRWDGIQHVDIGGNCLFIDDISVESIRLLIEKIANDKELYKIMHEIAINKGIPTFSYSKIARYAIEQ